MTMLVHLTNERSARSVKRSGIRGVDRKISGASQWIDVPRAVFVMPVLPNYYVTHQWLRELKRGGERTIVGVYIRMRSDAMVWVGKYNQEHRRVPLGHAAGLIMREPDARGWEIVISDGVSAKAIHDIREVPQVVGWRYHPESHKTGPWKCLCSYCLAGGGIKSARMQASLIARYGAGELNFDGSPGKLARLQKRAKKQAGQGPNNTRKRS